MKGVLGNVREDDILECGSRLQKYSVSTIISVVSPASCLSKDYYFTCGTNFQKLRI